MRSTDTQDSSNVIQGVFNGAVISVVLWLLVLLIVWLVCA